MHAHPKQKAHTFGKELFEQRKGLHGPLAVHKDDSIFVLKEALHALAPARPGAEIVDEAHLCHRAGGRADHISGGAGARRREREERRGAHRVLLERHGRASARHQHDAPARPPGPQMPLHKRLDLVADPGARRGHLYVARACEHPASSRVPAGGAKAQGAQTTGRVVCARVCARTHVCVCARVRANARTHAPGACAVRSALARGLAQGCVRARGGTRAPALATALVLAPVSRQVLRRTAAAPQR